MLHFFLDVVAESGTTFEQKLLGSRAIGTIDPANIEAILSTNFQDYSLGLRAPTFYPLLGSGIFTQDGASWRHSRQLLRPQFSSNRSRNFEQIKECVEGLIAAVPASGVVDLQPLCFRLTFDTTMFLLFGDSVAANDWGQVAGHESEFSKAFNVAQEYLADRGRLGPFFWILNGQRFREACRTCHRFMDGAVRKALAVSEKSHPAVGMKPASGQGDDENSGYVFIEALVHETRDPKVIRDQCLNVLLAGRDTTGCCLQWTLYVNVIVPLSHDVDLQSRVFFSRLLARYQKVLAKLRQEISNVVGLGVNAPQPTRDDLKRMAYLNLVIKEVLRLYPSVPVNSREAIRLTTLPVGGGPDGKSPIVVRPGEGVGYCVYAMHRRKDLYGEDADEFRPERWEGGALRDVGWGYLPFNGGPRLCLGRKSASVHVVCVCFTKASPEEFALLEVAYTVARVVQVFSHIELPPGRMPVAVGKEKQTLTLVVSCAEGCWVSLRP